MKSASLGPTPGPWIVEFFNKAPNQVVCMVNHLWNGTAPDGKAETHTDEIAEIVMDYPGDRAIRNADLLSAAPDLLAASKWAIECCGDEPCRLDHHGYCQTHNLQPADECWVKVLKDAVAKAEARP